MGLLKLVRDEVYNKIAAKKAAGIINPPDGFTYGNTFTLVKTWRPWTALEDLADPSKNPLGKVYVIGRNIGDQVNISRDKTVVGEFPVQIGFQRVITDIDDEAEVAGYVDFVEELADLCRLSVDENLTAAWTRHEFLRDPDGNPMSFIMQRGALTFEAYFTSVYTLVLPGTAETP